MRNLGVGGLAVVLAVSMAACGSSGAAIYTADPLRYLITIDQLATPNFTAFTAAAHVDATTLASGDARFAAALLRDGLRAAASVEYQRADDFATANGPLDVVATVERFSGVSGATTAYGSSVQQLDTISGAAPTSTGPLGDEAHAVSVVRATTGGLSAVEITLIWRAGNLVNTIVVRGRYGGTRLDDALVLAALQARNETLPSGSSGSAPVSS